MRGRPPHLSFSLLFRSKGWYKNASNGSDGSLPLSSKTRNRGAARSWLFDFTFAPPESLINTALHTPKAHANSPSTRFRLFIIRIAPIKGLSHDSRATCRKQVAIVIRKTRGRR